MSNFSVISWQEQVIFEEMMMLSDVLLDQHACLHAPVDLVFKPHWYNGLHAPVDLVFKPR
jgi:hypothetical protein